MPIVSKSERSRYLRESYPILHKLCVENPLPEVLSYRFRTELEFCYGPSGEGSPVPAEWDSEDVRVVPLWEGGSHLTAIRTSGESDEFVQIDYEDPGNVEVLAHSLKGLLTHLFFFLLEPLDEQIHSTPEAQELAVYLEFDDLAFVLQLLERVAGQDDYRELLAVTRSL